MTSVGLLAPPFASASTDVLGVAQSSATWTNPSTGTKHTFHWRFGVERELVVMQPVQWRFRAHVWCDYILVGSSSPLSFG